MDFVKLALACIQLVAFAVSYLRERRLIDSAQAEILADAMRGRADEIAKARKATDEVAAAAARDPASVLRDNDGFRRD